MKYNVVELLMTYVFFALGIYLFIFFFLNYPANKKIDLVTSFRVTNFINSLNCTVNLAYGVT